jgi:hypothetical protein
MFHRIAVISLLVIAPAFAQQPVATEDPVVKADSYWQRYHAQREAAAGQQVVSLARRIDDLAAQIEILKGELAAKASCVLAVPQPPEAPKVDIPEPPK